jgi:hypothetical protein
MERFHNKDHLELKIYELPMETPTTWNYTERRSDYMNKDTVRYGWKDMWL